MSGGMLVKHNDPKIIRWLTLTANDKKKEKHLLSSIISCKTLLNEQTVIFNLLENIMPFVVD